MRPLSLLLSATLLVLASAASARTMPYPQIDDPQGSGSTVQVTGPARTSFVTPEQASHINGSYAMSNGWHLKVQTQSRFVDATIDREKPMRLYSVGADKFVSRDGKVAMQFNLGAMGDDMTMSYVPDSRLGQVVVISSSRMAQR